MAIQAASYATVIYPSTLCIIDTTEQSPSDPQTQQLTYKKILSTFRSNFKLIGGSISDRELFRSQVCSSRWRSIMAGCGFTIAGCKSLSLNIPWPLSDRDIIETRKIAALRIHVERAIGRIMIFQICQEFQTNYFLSLW